jgi:DNA repair protein RecN (Recombination protein N)
MLERLAVRGLGIIDAVDLVFAPGFAVLTGETGAGKSLLVESLKLVGGQRAQSDMVRTGDERLQVEGVFSVDRGSPLAAILDELGAPWSDALILRREVTSAGRSRCWINDSSVTATALQRVAPHVLAIHGQHEQHGLADGGVQRGLVDDFGGHAELLSETRERFAAWQAAALKLDGLLKARTSRRDRLDAISFQLQEIDRLDPKENEDDELHRRRLVLRHSAKIAELRSSLLDRLSDGDAAVVDLLARAERETAEIVECGVLLEREVNRLSEARILVEDFVREVQALGDEVEADPGELESVESRLHGVEQLMLKYGPSLNDVLDHRRALIEERTDLLSVEVHLERAASAAAVALASFDRSAATLDEARRSAGLELTAAVEDVLARLAMSGTRLDFRWQARLETDSPLSRDDQPVAFDADGVEECTLLIAANPGEELRPMARIASGGELSRVHLAIRTVLRRKRSEGGLTLLFDEVDSGLGGATAAALAELLADLAGNDQVLVVTHLPQVAARAGGHFRVEKMLDGERATTRVVSLDDPQRESEVARMLAGGELTESARAHARVLLAGP